MKGAELNKNSLIEYKLSHQKKIVCDDQRGTKFLCEAVVLQVHVLHCSDNIAQCEISPMFYGHLLMFLPRCALAGQAELLVFKKPYGSFS